MALWVDKITDGLKYIDYWCSMDCREGAGRFSEVVLDLQSETRSLNLSGTSDILSEEFHSLLPSLQHIPF